MQPDIDPSWLEALEDEFEKDYMRDLSQFLRQEIKQGKQIYPPPPLIFNALNSTPLDKVKCVILGQDPYHGPGQAMGLSFSVPDEVTKPPSLRNIFKELADDLDCPIPDSGDLTGWTRQGVLLLNTVLTVEAGKANSHKEKGWERFTNHIIKTISDQREHLVFILWGKHAQEKEHYIDATKHKVLRSAHPSPFAAHRGFFGSKPFSRANEYLVSQGKEPIDWCLNK
jgi:uracil-DNA glycosylase